MPVSNLHCLRLRDQARVVDRFSLLLQSLLQKAQDYAVACAAVVYLHAMKMRMPGRMPQSRTSPRRVACRSRVQPGHGDALDARTSEPVPSPRWRGQTRPGGGMSSAAASWLSE